MIDFKNKSSIKSNVDLEKIHNLILNDLMLKKIVEESIKILESGSFILSEDGVAYDNMTMKLINNLQQLANDRIKQICNFEGLIC